MFFPRPLPSLPRTSATAGPDGELSLPKDPFHAYTGPTVFGPDTTQDPIAADSDTSQPRRAASPLDSDAEQTNLPPGLMDSPPHAAPDDPPHSPPATAIDQLCSSIITTRPPPVLPNPATIVSSTTAPPAASEEIEACTVKRWSQRLAALPVTSANPATRATMTKLKKLGLPLSSADPKAAKKRQLLLAYNGPEVAVAEAAIDNLLGKQP
jgi:hypothetical protein